MFNTSLPKLIRIKASFMSLFPGQGWDFDGREDGCFVTRCCVLKGKSEPRKLLVHLENLITPKELEGIRNQPEHISGCVEDGVFYSMEISTENEVFIRKVQDISDIRKEKGTRSFARVFNRIKDAINSKPLYR